MATLTIPVPIGRRPALDHTAVEYEDAYYNLLIASRLIMFASLHFFAVCNVRMIM